MTTLISSAIADLQSQDRTELVEASLEQAEASRSVFTRLYPDSARLAASHAQARHVAGIRQSPLAGLPVSIKDLLDVAGETTLAGSVVLHDAPPAKVDAVTVARLRNAGAAIIGKTNMTEFAFSGLGINPHYGTPHNPTDPEVVRIPGGSSSGAAVSVAAGMCVAALASDTGGSIRIPAAFCGLVGFKPTKQRVPTTGALPLSTTLDTLGAITRSVEDCILLDSILADNPLQIPALPLQGLKLAVPTTMVFDDIDAHVAASFVQALTVLSKAGATLVEIPLTLLNDYLPLSVFSGAEAWAWHRTLLESREAEYDPRVSRRIRMGAGMAQEDYLALHAARARWIAAMEAEIAPYDALVLPTSPIVAPPLAELLASDEAYYAANRLILRNNAAINMLDGCAITLPVQASGTLPVGLMLAGARLRDAHILGVARSVEQALAQAGRSAT
jgi:Asp-tRNA(Asn)/Glu-tRNA(Gln) amidotransferase A subunit family amidase